MSDTGRQARREFALARLVRAVQDYRQCLSLPTFTSDRDNYIRVSREEMLKRLSELEAI